MMSSIPLPSLAPTLPEQIRHHVLEIIRIPDDGYVSSHANQLRGLLAHVKPDVRDHFLLLEEILTEDELELLKVKFAI